jgi:site-specific DNA recombinase
MAENAVREGLKQRIAEMQQFLAEQTDEIKEYDEALVRRMIEKITVHEDRFTVEFKSGTSVDVER